MTDQDNLRDRMAEAMWREDAAVVLSEPYSLPPFYELDPHEQQAYRRSAQAIIDEFGLTVEERIDEPGKRGINPVQRVIGKWERPEQEPRP